MSHKFGIGDRVVLADDRGYARGGQAGKVTGRDHSEIPYLVEFDAGDTLWCREADLSSTAPAGRSAEQTLALARAWERGAAAGIVQGGLTFFANPYLAEP